MGRRIRLLEVRIVSVSSFFSLSFRSFLPSLFVFHLPAPPLSPSSFSRSFFLYSSYPLFLSFLPSLPVPRLGAHSCSRRMCAEIASVGMPHPKLKKSNPNAARNPSPAPPRRRSSRRRPPPCLSRTACATRACTA
ncbi:hypothetical protein B0H14DRAFT_2961135, partial [Mycena olivaceomarginata]